MIQRSSVLLLLVGALMLGGCSVFKKAAKPHPMVGGWAHTIDTPDGTFTGVLAFTEVDRVLGGTISFEQGIPTATLQDIVFEEPELSFKFDTEQYGTVLVSVTVDEDRFSGTLDVPESEAFDIPIRGERQASTP